MRKTIEVVDGFYRDPMERRELALRSPWVATGPGLSAGFDAWTEAFVDHEATERLGTLIGRPAGSSFPSLSGRFTFVGAEESDSDDAGRGQRPATPHVHDEHWAALVYLATPDDGPSSGIAFYRPASVASVSGDWGSSGVHEVRHPDNWEETMYVPLTFNRMVLFRASTAHECGGRGFGQNPESGRIVQLFLFDEPDAGARP